MFGWHRPTLADFCSCLILCFHEEPRRHQLDHKLLRDHATRRPTLILMQKRTIATGALILNLIVTRSATGTGRPQTGEPRLATDKAIRRIDLENLGFRPKEARRWYHLSLDFADGNHVVLGANTSDVHKTRWTADLDVVVFDLSTGLETSSHHWQSSRGTLVNGVGGGRLLICTGKELGLYSWTFSPIWERALDSPVCGLGVSPSRRSFSFRLSLADQSVLMDVLTLSPRASWTNEAEAIQFTDTMLAGNCGAGRELCTRSLTGPWETLEVTGMNQRMNGAPRKVRSFVNDSTVLITAGHEIALVALRPRVSGHGPDGLVLFYISLPERVLLGAVATSIAGSRFAVLERKMRGLSNPAADLYPFPSDDRAVVYSVKDGSAIYVRKLRGTSPWTPWDEHENAIALSPDGTLLAIADDKTLSVYALPKEQ